jgi:hypothetical protein
MREENRKLWIPRKGKVEEVIRRPDNILPLSIVGNLQRP